MFKHQNAPTCEFLQTCRFTKCQFSHNDVGDKLIETDTDIDESDHEFEGEPSNKESDSNQTKKTNVTLVRCDYGLCDFENVLFQTKSDFNKHMINDHGAEWNGYLWM